jgi:hypothetical protein
MSVSTPPSFDDVGRIFHSEIELTTSLEFKTNSVSIAHHRIMSFGISMTLEHSCWIMPLGTADRVGERPKMVTKGRCDSRRDVSQGEM